MAFQFVFLTQEFYDDYKDCCEIEYKVDRPHIRVVLKIEGIEFAIPMRSNIRHSYAYILDKINKCGIDYTKAVVISDPKRYINTLKYPYVRKNEFENLKGKEKFIEDGMLRYLKTYRKALLYPTSKYYQNILRYSTLQYFHNYILNDHKIIKGA